MAECVMEGSGANTGAAGEAGLNEAQREVLERCLHALKQAKNDSHTLAALLLITRLCPANQLDKPTLRRIFEAVGLNLPARLLVTATRGSGESSGLAQTELLSLGTALLAALTTDPEVAHKPQLLSTIPILLQILSQGITQPEGSPKSQNPENGSAKSEQKSGGVRQDRCLPLSAENEESRPQSFSKIDEAIAADCYQVLFSISSSPRGPEHLLNRGAVRALCQAVERNQTFSHEKGIPLLGCLLSGKTKEKAWSKHSTELFNLLSRTTTVFCQASEKDRLGLCSKLVQFLPPAEAMLDSEKLKELVGQIWEVLRPMVQSKLSPKQMGQVLVLGACLLDVCGWEAVGPPKFCCLLVNRACVEVRMGLEEPPGNQLSADTQQTLTGCYRIMEAAMEQACTSGASESDRAPGQSSRPGLSLQQSRQVLGVLQEAFSAVIYHLQQVDERRHGDPFVFASFRSLCSWLAEETSCLKEEVTALLPFLIGYCRSHMSGGGEGTGLSDWMDQMSVSGERALWTGKEPLRYLLPALCHLSAEDAPRKVLLSLDTPQLLVAFLSQSWSSMNEATARREPSLETACSALLNFTVTEPQRVMSDPCFRVLESLLTEALPVAMHKPALLVLAANFCTLALMMRRLRTEADPVDSAQLSLFSCCLRFLPTALAPGADSGPATVSPLWVGSWEEVADLWRLSVQALSSCVRTQPWTVSLLIDQGWLRHTLSTLGQSNAPPDEHTLHALQEALCVLAECCPLCKQEITRAMESDRGGLSAMVQLKRLLSAK